jgi:hypothetical protein
MTLNGSQKRGRPRVVSAASQLGSPRGRVPRGVAPTRCAGPSPWVAPVDCPARSASASPPVASRRGVVRSVRRPHRLSPVSAPYSARDDKRITPWTVRLARARQPRPVRCARHGSRVARKIRRAVATRSIRSRPSSRFRWRTSWWSSRLAHPRATRSTSRGHTARPLPGCAADEPRTDVVRGDARSHHGLPRAVVRVRATRPTSRRGCVTVLHESATTSAWTARLHELGWA